MAKTSAQLTEHKDDFKMPIKPAASTTLYGLCMAFLDANGYGVNTTGSGANRFAGIVQESGIDNSGGDAGDATGWVYTNDVWLLTGTGLTQADVGKRAYATDNYTITTDPTAANAVFIGVIEAIESSTQAWVDIGEPANSALGVDLTARTITITGATGVPKIILTDNLANALDITEAANSYIKLVTTNSSESVVIGKDLTIADAKNIVLDTTTGTKIGTGTTQKLGFFNATPVAQRSAYTQTFSTADKTHDNPTAVALTDNSAGSANTTIQALTDGSTYANDVAAIRNNFADLAASNNAIIVDLADVKALVNSLIDDLQALGLVG